MAIVPVTYGLAPYTPISWPTLYTPLCYPATYWHPLPTHPYYTYPRLPEPIYTYQYSEIQPAPTYHIPTYNPGNYWIWPPGA